VAIVNDLMTSRLKQFEHLVAVELPILAEDLRLDSAARGALNRYVEQHRNWMSGVLEWHRGTSRYLEAELESRLPVKPVLIGPTGLGTTAMRSGARSSTAGRSGAVDDWALSPRAHRQPAVNRV
jgi:germacradienol/geosmin synthase